jgi:hypothetical protein
VHAFGDHRENTTYRWTKPGRDRLSEEWSTWQIDLDLVTTANRNVGSLSIYRLYSDQPLLLDINLLTYSFPIALADSLDRVLVPVIEVSDDPLSSRQIAAAHAG